MKEEYLVVVEDSGSVDDSIQIYIIDGLKEATKKFEDEVEHEWKQKQRDSTYKEHDVYLCKILSSENIPSNPIYPEKLWST